MKTSALKQKLHDYIDTANEKKLKAIYTILEQEIEDKYDWRSDEEWLAELNRREEECLKGSTKTYSLDETLARVRQAIHKPVANK